MQEKCPKASTVLEKAIAKLIADIETATTIPSLKTGLKGLYFTTAKEVEVDGVQVKKAVLIFVPPPKLGAFRAVQKQLVEELEKKLSSQHVLIVANRTMVGPKSWARSDKYTGVRPRSRSLKTVQEALLDDLVFPTEITGKRIRVKADGTRLLKVTLSNKDQAFASDKTETFKSVYKKLTSRDVSFAF